MVTAKSFDKLQKELDEIREKSCRKYSINFSLMSICSYHGFFLIFSRLPTVYPVKTNKKC